MIDNLLPFLMLGILIAAVLAKPLSKQKLVQLSDARTDAQLEYSLH